MQSNQQRKALLLSLLMFMLAQTAYIESYRGWTTPQLEGTLTEPARVSSPAVCASASRSSGDSIYVDVVEGSNDYSGTISCPLSSLEQAITIAGSESASNPEIILRAGLYHENVSIDNIDNLLIRAADGERVVFDGTRSITDDLGGVWGSADSDGIQEVTLSQDGWQLFLAHEEQVPARWPNAQLSDDTVFNRSYWAEGTLTNSNNAYTIGWLTDAGPEAGVHTGLNETVNASGLDPVGAIAVMNLGSFRSNSRIITDWNPNNGTFAYDGTGVGWKTKHHAYFLEGKRELIDQDGEWWFNNSNNRLHYKPPSSRDANDLDLRVKVQPFAVSVDNSDGVAIQGIDFFGTTVNFNNCDGCSLTNASLQYPSTSKRGLGIAGESEDDRWMTRFYRSTNSFVDNISITNTDGGALEFQGSGGQSHNNTVNNSYFHAIDWSAADQKGLMTTIYEGGRDMYFTNNSVHLTGASSVLSIGDAPKVFYNEVWDVGHLQTDGAVVQVMQGEAPGAEIAYNWIHDVIKYGARFDAPINQVGTGANGTMHHNVIWNAAGGLMVKGDYHDIHNNTVFNSTGKNDIIFLTDGGINNKNSTLHYNAVDAMADHRSDDVFANPLPNGSHWSNWNGYIQGYDGMFEARNQHTCALYENNSLYCWGRNNYGQLGLGTTSSYESSPQFVDVGSGLTVESIGISGSGDQASGPKSHTCAVLSNGQLKCWGDNADGQLGLGNVSSTGVWEPTAVNLGAGRTAVDVATANAATCALLDDQSVKCWGRNTRGQLGLGNDSSNDVLTPQLVTFSGSSKPIKLAGALRSFCAIMDNGTMACWGENADGQLGLGNQTSMVRSPTYLSTHTGRTVISVDLGKYFTCVSYDNGSVACTGTNDVGQLGLGNFTSSSTLQYVADMDVNAYRTDVAQKVGCAHLTNASLVCWGHDQWGLFGYSTNTYGQDYGFTANKYAVFPSGRTLASFSVGFTHACAVLDNGDLACWGNNNMAQLGLGNTSQQWIPVVVSNVSSIHKMAVHEMLVDPANNDFRPNWGSHLHVLNAGAYAADDADPWTAGISWTYTTPNAPVAGCMLDYADNYDSDATLSDGSCLFASYTPPSTLDLRLHLDPTNSSSYSGSGTNLVDLSTYGNDGTIDGAAWEANRTRFYYDGSCSGSSAPANQAGAYVCDEVTFAETNDHDPDANGDWSVSVWMNATTVQHSVIIGKWNGGGSASDLGYIIRIGSDNKLYTSVGTTSGSSAVSTSRISIDEDRWYHLVMVADAGNILRFYVDGVNVVNASLSGSGSIRNTTSGISIGSYNAGEYNQPFDGNIGEVMIFAEALNSTTINQMYTASKGTYSNTTSLSYSDSSYTFVKGQAYNLPLSVSNGDLTTSYTLLGSLPTGMSFGSENGTIWGTPTADMSSTNYTVTANNSAGSFSTTFSIQIMSAPSGISYSPSSMILEKDTAMTTNTPSYSGSTVTSWSISPALPSGLNFDTSTGAISGTPSVLQTSAQSYTITATNSQGSATTSVSITINDQAPDVSYTSPVEISNNREMTTISPVNTGGTVTSWVITPSLPTGLSFGSTNGSIWGVPENVTSDVTYTIWANNSGGTNSTTLTLGVNWTLTPSVAGVSLTRNSSIGTDITWEWDYDPLEASNLTMFATWRNTCAIRDDGDLYCWGRNGNGQLGTGSMGSNTWKTRPTRTNSLGSDAVSVSMGEQHTCAVLDTGVLKCWGRNNHGQVGAGPGGDEDTPQTINVGSGRTVTSAYLGFHHTCAILDDQSVKCWGRNQDGELGVGSTTSSFNTPQSIASLGTNRYALSLALGQGFTCALLDDGSIKCWGQDNLGQRGDGGGYGSDIRSPPSSAITLPTGRTAKQISAGEFHVCALLDDDSVVCWGNNAEGQLGDGTTSHRTAPVNVSSFGSGHTVSYVSAGYDHVCALLTDGGVRCWGSNNNGQLGDGTSTDRSTPPSSDVNLGSGYTAIGISSGGGHTCAMLHDGDMKCWGARGSGQVGDDSALGSNDVLSPVFVQGSRVWEEGDFLTSPAVTGATCAISPALPTGLTLTSGTCAISGTPTVTAYNTTYTVWANVSGNSFSGQVWIEVVLNTPNPSYSPSTFTFTNNTSISSINPANTGGEISSWSISPSLPSGLSFGTTNGSIWGTPTSISSTTSYTITATNSAGSSNSAISITVNDIAPSVVYNPNTLTLTRGVTMPALDINNTGGAITTCSPSPSLPSGLSISNSCQITGTPSSVLSSTTYTITASNSGGSDSTTITIQVNDVPPNTIIYNPHNMSLVRNTAMSANTPSVSGGSVTTWAISPALPSGLTFSTNSGLISGTPSTLQTSAQLYTVWANNSGGSASTTINITILEQAPSGLNYNPSALSLTVNTTMSPSYPIVFGGAIASWQISPALPAGLSFGTSNGSIWGAPTSIQSLTTYTIWANNSGGSNSTTITITVNDQIPTLTYTPNNLVLYKDSQSSVLPLNATLNGSGTITSWAISSALPAGLNFGSSNGTIWGIPTVLQTTAVTYTIWANNSGGSSVAYVNVTINDVAPGPFEYNPENNTWTNNSYVNIGPAFINETSGNGSIWQVADIQSGQSGSVPSSPSYGWRIVVDDTMYFTANDGITGYELWAYNTSNGTTWQAADINSGSGSSLSSSLDVRPMAILVGETIYFSADDGSSGEELWAHNTSSHSTWRVADIRSGLLDSQPGKGMYVLIGDIIVFDATDYYNGRELWTHNTATNSTSRVTQLASGSASINAGTYMSTVVGSRVYFTGFTGTSIGTELYAYDTSNTSAWLVADINSGSDGSIPGYHGTVLIGDTLYFSADDGSTGHELWAHDTSNHSTWQVADINSGASDGLSWKTELAGDTVIDGVIYFTATDGNTGHELWAHSTSNGTTWQVADINSGPGNSNPADRMGLIISGDTFYFLADDGPTGRELWAHDTSNRSTWRVTDLNSGSGNGYAWTMDVIGDTLYFIGDDGNTGWELWAYDTSNQSTWLVYDIYTGPNSSRFNDNWFKEVLVGNHLVFSADDGSTGQELWAHYPSSINYQTNTGGNVTTWAINASLPSGVSFGTNNGTIYGTPTELWTQTSYMIWANNSGGSSVAYLNITVVEELPTLSYSPSTLVLTMNNQSSDLPLNATLTGSGEITSWEINATLPAGLNFGTSNGTIWGIPTVLQTTAVTYTIWANNSGGSTSATINITINDEAPGPFEYIPENNTWTNNSYVNIGPSFINETSGNGSRWSASLPNTEFAVVVGDIVYLTGAYVYNWGDRFYALNTSNGTGYHPNPTWYLENGSASGYSTFNHGRYMSYLIGDVIYFDAGFGYTNIELFAYNTSNNSGWRVKDINTNNTPAYSNSNPGQHFSTLMGDTIYFSASSGNASLGVELWAHDTSNGTTWRVGHTNTTGTLPNIPPSPSYGRDLGVIDDTIYFQAWGSSGEGMWAYNTSNTTMWEVEFSSAVRLDPGKCMAVVVGDSLYFDADGSTHGRELWAHNHANQTTWMVKDLETNTHYQSRDSSPGCLGMSGVLVGDTFYFTATKRYTDGNNELWAHSTSNHSTWLVADIMSSTTAGSVPGHRFAVVIGDTIYFDAKSYNDGGNHYNQRDLWAYDTSNKSTWEVYNFSRLGSQGITGLIMAVGDTIYLAADDTNPIVHGLWAYDTSNQSTWLVENGSSGMGWGFAGYGTNFFINGTLYTSLGNCNSYSPGCNAGYNLLSINYQTNTGGNVTSWAINGSLPSGVTFNTQTGVISGTPTELWPQTTYMVWANNSGGSSTAYLNITVVDQLPTIAYSPTDIALTNNTTSTDLPLIPTLTGAGEITSWAINASLPAGLTFETSNGTILGTPTELWTQTAYMVWANNSGGSSIAYLNITVVDQLPTISYVPENLTLTNNTASSDLPLAPTINGPGEITSWAINATLPAGLTFGSNNGTIYGTPTELWPTTPYTIWANNSGGSSVAYLNITIVDELPASLNYIPNGQNATINTAITAMNPSLTGPGQITSWEILPVLPQGVQFNSSTGVITGTPAELWTNTTYTIWANNTGGSINTTIWLMVTLPAPNISYNFVNITLTSNVSSINYNATNSGGDIAYGDNVIHGHSDVFCALSEQGQVVCWGDNIDGVARPGASTSADYSPSIVSMPTGRYATALAVGNEFACALLDNGSVACWGDADSSTALEYWDGDGIIEPTLMPGLGETTIAIDIDAGYAHACVILSNLSAMCWGTNAWDNLGINSNSLSATPAHVSVIPSGRTIIDITAGHTHTCALLDNASVYCWGDNQRGQIGVGYTSSSIANGAYAQLNGKQVSVLEAGRDSTCVAFTGGGASCWGKNRDGMLGDGTTIDRSSPTEVQGLGDNDSISSFELSFDTTCIITTENIAICWGDETGNVNGASTSPVEVDFPANRYAISIALDHDNGCAILDNGSVSCWGSGSDKNFGDNSTSYSRTPVSGVTQISHRANVGGYSIRGGLPQGIQFSASNGTVWGMPTEVISQFVNYSVTVYNSAGSSTYSFSIQVIDLLPTISYNPENLTFTNNTGHPDLPLAPNITGAGSITSWEISPSLPAGLNFGSENGTVWGVPNQLLNLTTFTVFANNSGGSSTATINITIVDQVPVLIYNPSNITLTRGEQSDVLPLQPNLSGPGDVLTWEISPALPSGIQFGSDNGTIWGIPIVNMTQTSFTIWANNSGGQTNFTINITILEPVAIFDYQPENLTLVRNETMTSLHPLITGGNPLTWEISPTLPSGLSFFDGVISGTPAVNSSTVMYTIWANNSGGSSNHTINVTILEPTGDLFYNPENLTLIRNQSITTLNPTFTGGSVDNWSIFPTLPSGLLFNNGIISGTPLVNSTTVTYTIWANNSGGVATATINITILEPIVNLSYNPENITLIRNQSMNTLHPTVTGGVVSEWSIYPSLPLGLNFTNGVISGTPEVNMTTTMYSIYANTSAGSTFANINITILEPVVNLSFQPTEIILIRNSSMTPISAVVSGGSVASWEISPQLPSGLTFIDGTLNGTPLVNLTRSEFTIYANTSGGSANFSINITILEPAPQILINPQNVTLMRYEQMDPVSAEVIGDGMPENWSIHPVLPEGLFFENGTIYGTPAVNLTRSTFIIWANNTGGSTSIPFDIEILEPLPNITYSPENYTLTRGLDNVTINPISTGGMVANWSIYPELPQGMSFENGSISGISIVESLNVTYVITAVNSGGSAVAYLNISVVEQLPELSIEVNLSLVRYGEPANLKVNNSGGNASNWEIHPELPDGLSFVDGVLSGVAQVNSTETVYTVWANNSGGSASASFNLEIHEPSPDISYQTESYVVVYDATEVLIVPINTGGVPETWEISPQLPQGLQFRNGVISGIATEEMNQTNYTVWANNSLGSSMTSFTLEVNYPVFFARYEKTRIVLEVNETMMPLTPIYYFGPSQSPSWSISDELPEGMKFKNGFISGTPQHPLNETQYTITVTGEMAPVELFVVIHVLGDWPQNVTVVNETIEQPEPESPNEPELNFVIPLIFLLLLFVAALVGGNIFLAVIADDDEEEDEEDSENEDDSDESGA